MAQGIVYALINPSLEGLVKVGKTTRSAAERARELSSHTGVPSPFIVVYERPFQDCDAAENYVHMQLENMGYRLTSNREFFSADVKDVINIIIEAPDNQSANVDTDFESVQVEWEAESEEDNALGGHDVMLKGFLDSIFSPQPTPANNSSMFLFYTHAKLLHGLYEQYEALTSNIQKFSTGESLAGLFNQVKTDLRDIALKLYSSYSELFSLEDIEAQDLLIISEVFQLQSGEHDALLESFQSMLKVKECTQEETSELMTVLTMVLYRASTASIIMYLSQLHDFVSAEDLSLEQTDVRDEVIAKYASELSEFQQELEQSSLIEEIVEAIFLVSNLFEISRKIVKENHIEDNAPLDESLRNIFSSFRNLRIQSFFSDSISAVISATKKDVISAEFRGLMNTANQYRYGDDTDGILQSPSEAQSLLLKLAKSGCDDAYLSLGEMHMNHELENSKTNLAVHYFYEATKRGHIKGYIGLAKVFALENNNNFEICLGQYLAKTKTAGEDERYIFLKDFLDLIEYLHRERLIDALYESRYFNDLSEYRQDWLNILYAEIWKQNSSIFPVLGLFNDVHEDFIDSIPYPETVQ